ncbi:MAG: uracil-DNA glycosylase [Planctomycetota bacterium]
MRKSAAQRLRNLTGDRLVAPRRRSAKAHPASPAADSAAAPGASVGAQADSPGRGRTAPRPETAPESAPRVPARAPVRPAAPASPPAPAAPAAAAPAGPKAPSILAHPPVDPATLAPLPAFALPVAADDVRQAAGAALVERVLQGHRGDPAPGLAKLFGALPAITRGGLTADQKRLRLADEAHRAAGCTRCTLCKTRTQVVYADGNPDAEVLFIGEGPGADEDAQGVPFVGRAGRRLTDIIEKGMQVPRQSVYICNIVKCRPPENRVPEPAEAAACRGWLEKQLEIVAPRIVVVLGNTALKGLLGYTGSMASAHGQFFKYRGLPVVPTYHPSWLIRMETPEKKRIIWNDFKQVIGYLNGSIPGPA